MGKKTNVCKVSQLGDLINALSNYQDGVPISPISVDWDDDGILLFSRIYFDKSDVSEEVKMALNEIDEVRETLGTVQNRIEAVAEGLGDKDE